MTGADRDAHGCIGSAGYVWSSLKNECIRSFELADYVEVKDGSATFKEGIAFSEDKNQAELFSTQGTFILTKNKKGDFEGKKQDGSSIILSFQDSTWKVN